MAKNNILIQAARKRFDELDRDDPRFDFGFFRNFNYIMIPDFAYKDITLERCKLKKNKLVYTIDV